MCSSAGNSSPGASRIWSRKL